MKLCNRNEIIEKIKQLPIISRFDKSLEYPANCERYAFSLYERPDESSAIIALRTILKVTGFESQYEIIVHIAHSIQGINGTKKLPLYGVGFSLYKEKVIQLKVYYILTIVNSERDDAMSKFDNDANSQVIQHLLQELHLEEKIHEVNSLVDYMNNKGNNMHILGLNVEKGKPLSLKLYFRMKK